MCCRSYHDKWVPVTTEWRVLRLRVEERSAIWRVVANILNMQWWTADKGWSSSLGLGGVLTTPHCKKVILLRNVHTEQPTRGGPPAWGLGEVLTIPRRKNVSCCEMFTQKASDRAFVNAVMNFCYLVRQPPPSGPVPPHS